MKTEEEIKKFLKSKKVLLWTNNSTDRSSWKTLLNQLGVHISNFSNVSTLAEAEEAIDEGPEILFVFHNIENPTTIHLIRKHFQVCPDRSEALCFVCSDKNSLALASQAAEHTIDGLLLKPYTSEELGQLLKKALEEKVSMSKKEKLFFRIQGQIFSDDLAQAEKKIEEYLELSPESPYPYFLKGRLFEEKNNYEEAITSYLKALEWDEKNYKALTRLFDLFIEAKDFESAYECGKVLSDNYPVNPDRIPNIIRASLGTQNFKNLVDFCEMILNVDDDLSAVAKPIAAALSISSSHLAADPKMRDLVIASAKRAIKLSHYDSPIFATSLETLLAVEDLLDAEKVLEKIPSDDMNDDLSALELQFIFLKHGAAKAYEKGQTLIKADKITVGVYEYVIRSAKGIGKSESQVEDIAFKATREFPELKEYFIQLTGFR